MRDEKFDSLVEITATFFDVGDEVSFNEIDTAYDFFSIENVDDNEVLENIDPPKEDFGISLDVRVKKQFIGFKAVLVSDSLVGGPHESYAQYIIDGGGLKEAFEPDLKSIVDDAVAVYAEVKALLVKREASASEDIDVVRWIAGVAGWSSEYNTPDGHDYDGGITYLGRLDMNKVAALFSK